MKFSNIQDGFMVLVGIAAFIIGSCLFISYSNGKTGYIDPGVNVKQACLAAVSAQRQKDNAQLRLLRDQSAQANPSNSGRNAHGLKAIDTTPGHSAKDSCDHRLLLLKKEELRIAYSWDSAYQIPAGFRSSLLFARDSFVAFIRNYHVGDSLGFYYTISDTSTTGIKFVAWNIRGQLKIEAADPDQNHMDMFRKYPSTAFWVLLSIAQFTFWALTALLCIAVFYQLREEIRQRQMEPDPASLHTSWVVTLIALVCFIVILYILIYYPRIGFDHFFLAGFYGKMYVYGIVGYVTAFLFLSGYLRMAYYVRLAQDKFANNARDLKTKKADMNVHLERLKTMAGNMSPAITTSTQNLVNTLSQDLDAKSKEVEVLKDNYQLCNRYFRFFFGASAVVLSILVIWVGSLFQAGNELDLFHLYAQETGHPFLPNDFVYLYGGLHSLLLFIFYIPVKMRLMSMSFAIPADSGSGTVAETGPDWQGYLKKFFSRFVEILTAGSPLLAASLEKLFS